MELIAPVLPTGVPMSTRMKTRMSCRRRGRDRHPLSIPLPVPTRPHTLRPLDLIGAVLLRRMDEECFIHDVCMWRDVGRLHELRSWCRRLSCSSTLRDNASAYVIHGRASSRMFSVLHNCSMHVDPPPLPLFPLARHGEALAPVRYSFLPPLFRLSLMLRLHR